MNHLPTHQQQRFETPNHNWGTPLATPSTGAQEVSVVRQCQLPGGFNPFHSHDREEVMVVLEGEVTIQQQELPAVHLKAGDSLIVPARVVHQVRNGGTEPATWLLIAPAQVQFLKEDGTAATPPWAR